MANLRTVAIVDNDDAVRDSMCLLLETHGFEARAYRSGTEFLRDNPEVGCLIVDHHMPGLNGLGLQEALETRGACEQIVFITGHGDVSTATRAMKKGAVDFLTKPFNDTELIEAVKRALERSEEQLRHRGERQDARGRVDKLTPREFEVLRFVVMGLLNKQIASELHTAEKTIKVHRGRVMQKLGVTSVPDLVRVSQRAGVVPDRNRA